MKRCESLTNLTEDRALPLAGITCLDITPEPPLASKLTVKPVVFAMAGLLRLGADRAKRAATTNPSVFTFIGQY
jgi:hypothetical protein